VKIVRTAICAPLRQIADNAGTPGSVVVRRVMESKDNEGYNALTGEYVDMVKAGILTPTKVERVALQNAAEVAIPASDHRLHHRRSPEERRRR